MSSERSRTDAEAVLFPQKAARTEFRRWKRAWGFMSHKRYRGNWRRLTARNDTGTMTWKEAGWE